MGWRTEQSTFWEGHASDVSDDDASALKSKAYAVTRLELCSQHAYAVFVSVPKLGARACLGAKRSSPAYKVPAREAPKPVVKKWLCAPTRVQ